MQTNQENNTADAPDIAPVSTLERRLDMSVSLAVIDQDVEQRLKHMSRSVKMPGFRPGKVPFKMVVQQYGPQARSEAIGEAVDKAFGDLLREQKLRIAGYPRIEPKNGDDKTKLEFSATFEVYPEIK
ncbi:MAG: trigger factor, partial [Proteobacteria bacterium]|nr:trigger factor [Pseudomonadota bacterium]